VDSWRWPKHKEDSKRILLGNVAKFDSFLEWIITYVARSQNWKQNKLNLKKKGETYWLNNMVISEK
jgi:hypothetical protein